MTAQEIFDLLREQFGDAVLALTDERPQPRIQVDPMRVDAIARFLRDDARTDCDRLLLVSGVDWEGLDASGKGKHRAISRYEEDGSVQPVGDPGTGDLGVLYHLQSRRHLHLVVLEVRLPRETPRVATLGGVYTTAQWAERETYDFYGIEFVGHEDLRRLFLPEDWEGWPLRKDYQMPSVYHDVPLEGLSLAVREQPSLEEQP